jgi:exopolysaccharide biosynthesis polyprenyl glycosylphosphotransferase
MFCDPGPKAGSDRMTTSQGPVGDTSPFLAGFTLGSSSRTDTDSARVSRSGRATFARYGTGLLLTDAAILAAVAIGGVISLQSNPALPPFIVAASVALLVALTVNRSRSRRIIGTGLREFSRILVAGLFTFGLLAICILLANVKGAHSLFTGVLPVDVVALLFGRTVWRCWFVLQRAHGRHLSRTLVIGPAAEVVALTKRLGTDPAKNFEVVGFVLDDSESDSMELDGQTIPVFPVLTTIATIVAATRADLVIVAGQRAADQDFVRELGWSLEETSVDLAIASGLDNVADARIHVESVAGLPLMHVQIPTFAGAKHVVKRGFDASLVAVALLVLAPVFAVIAIAVKFDSRGPVLFRQVRVGRDGRTFEMLKFRSMVQTAERDLADLMDQNEGSGVLFKLKNDPRITTVGKFLRKYSLDELPQLWNILVGDMSIVGPRPPLPREVSQYEEYVNRRLFIKPGLTGLWQVSGRSDLSWEQSVRLDLYYVANWSLAGDLNIMWRTVWGVVPPPRG